MNKLIKRFRYFQKKHNLKHQLKYIKTRYHSNEYLYTNNANVMTFVCKKCNIKFELGDDKGKVSCYKRYFFAQFNNNIFSPTITCNEVIIKSILE